MILWVEKHFGFSQVVHLGGTKDKGPPYLPFLLTESPHPTVSFLLRKEGGVNMAEERRKYDSQVIVKFNMM